MIFSSNEKNRVFKLCVPETNILTSKCFILALKSIKIVYLCNKKFPLKQLQLGESPEKSVDDKPLTVVLTDLHHHLPQGPGAIAPAVDLHSITAPTFIVSFSHFKWSLVHSKGVVSVAYS